MEIRQKYIDFILENIIQSQIKIQLPIPGKDGRNYCVQEGTILYMDINIQVVARYTRAVKLKLNFDTYEKEQIFFIPIAESPELIERKLHYTLKKIVMETFENDGRRQEIKQWYDDAKKNKYS
ncbi:hypothetical protein [Flavobacterium aciduliphilum]|uniref:Uncharacterized protein n=1 Tax=Flavobacterium aciduliphilum TaxID=1101402 RepID=A0A328YID0_9FLAO|nr:hypothetical protein [Flavobacterium aciduliphilum]RAR73719.1 hypothetical protein CLV55_10338 [Flavobacterium aciduliphilum]